MLSSIQLSLTKMSLPSTRALPSQRARHNAFVVVLPTAPRATGFPSRAASVSAPPARFGPTFE